MRLLHRSELAQSTNSARVPGHGLVFQWAMEAVRRRLSDSESLKRT
jgi:hypothetical protein